MKITTAIFTILIFIINFLMSNVPFYMALLRLSQGKLQKEIAYTVNAVTFKQVLSSQINNKDIKIRVLGNGLQIERVFIVNALEPDKGGILLCMISEAPDTYSRLLL